MNRPICTWEYMDNSPFRSQPGKIDYCGDYILHHTRGKTYSYPTKVLLTHRCMSNYKTETIIMKYLVEHHQFPTNELSEKEEKHWRFWKNLGLFKLPEIYCLPSHQYILLQRFLMLSPEGVYGGSYEKPEKIDYYYDFRLDHLFFEGPEIARISLEDRKMLRQAVLEALNPASGFSINDAFVLFDYEKIPTQNWEFNDGYESLSITLFSNYFRSASSREDSENVIFNEHSIEEIWAKRPNFLNHLFHVWKTLPDTLKDADNFIEKVLSNAIIK